MTEEKKKVSLQDLVKQKLANKQQEQAKSKAGGTSSETKQMKSQQAKKNTIQRRKMGG
ncbi:hypothetical protein [Desulfuribacillus stibiiarsenatis]|uniref:hypothetical protein n=1 Tax=Desulfuribacillus stibiiarsenatis TaxID=1390249 RepID=UPI0015B4BFB7|nr:hypothetical protein [Desulfuribacillus stibiiarsenatis]